MKPQLLLDTHILVRWLASPKSLSREQTRVLRSAARRREPVAISAITLLEIAILFGEGNTRSKLSVAELLGEIDSSPTIEVLPFSIDVASEVASIGPSLRDPADRAIVCTARVHRLRLVTSDQRIVNSNLVPVIS